MTTFNYKGTDINFQRVCDVIEELEVTEIVSGGATGADMFGEQCASVLHIPVKIFKADWNKYSQQAGLIRNIIMAEYADALLLFPGGTGSMHMRKTAMKNNLIIKEGIV